MFDMWLYICIHSRKNQVGAKTNQPCSGCLHLISTAAMH